MNRVELQHLPSIPKADPPSYGYASSRTTKRPKLPLYFTIKNSRLWNSARWRCYKKYLSWLRSIKCIPSFFLSPHIIQILLQLNVIHHSLAQSTIAKHFRNIKNRKYSNIIGKTFDPSLQNNWQNIQSSASQW